MFTGNEADIELEEESVNKSKSIQPVSARTDSSKRSKKIDDDEECKSRNIVDDEAQTVQTITNIRNNESPPLDEKKSQENNETGRTVGHGEENDAGTPLSSDVTAETVEFSQLNEKYDERSETLGDTSVGAANVEEVAAESISNCNTLAEIGNFIIEGYGELLLNSKSNNEQIQRFINHLPIYLKQIDLIHECCIVGDLEELQKYLDRRKLAIARENKSSLYLTPLHIAVARNHRSVVKYLAGRFPETLKVVDKLGRTPLHFAAIHPDGKYVYNVLLTLGADKTVEDENNCTAEYYYEHPHIELYNQIKNTLKRLLHEEGLQSSVTPLTHTLESVMNFNQLEQDYILNVLGEALKKSLLAVVHARPTQPIKFLAEYLYGFANNMIEQESLLNEKSEREISAKKSEEQKILKHKTKAIFKDKEIRFAKQKRNSTVKNDDKNDKRKNRDYGNTNVNKGDAENTTVNKRDTENTAVSNTNVEFYLEISNQFHPLSRDKYGRTIIHYAATRIHSRNGFLQQLKELKGNVAYRDELYRTARDLAIFSENYENVKAIDEYVLQIVANGESEKITQLLLDGYDHIVEIECDEDVINCAKKRGHKKLLTVLKTIPLFEKTRDELHNAIRNGNKFQVIQLMRKCGKDASMMALCRSCTYRCSLHIAVLTEKKDIIEYLIKKFPETLCVGDNLDRTALHYAMALNAVEQLSNILIKAGADRTAKDLKGRQPSYYFINKHEILLMCPQELC